MNGPRVAALVGGGLIGGMAAVWSWVALPALSPCAERLWTSLNHLFKGRPPGWASDLELMLVFSAGAVLAASAVSLVWRAAPSR